MIQSGAAVLFTFGLVIFLHELGHFIVCRLLKVKVERFAFGFGPELWGMTTAEGTRLSVCALPLGGFVKPAGENLEECTGAPEEYFSRKWYERLGILAAGPGMNYLLAFFLFAGVALAHGMPEASTDPVIGELAVNYPAGQAGIKVDDRVIRLGKTPITSWEQLADIIHKSPGKAVELTLMRGDKMDRVTVTPRLDEESGHGLIGIRSKTVFRKVGLLESGREGARQCWLWTKRTVTTLAEKIYRGEKPDLAGPIGIVQMVTQAARSSLQDLIYLMGVISVAVGFFNLLPIPLLDGGWAVLCVWEGVSGRKLTLKLLAVVNSVGMVFLLSILVFATYNDLMRIRQGRRDRAAQKAPVEAPASPPKTAPAGP